MRMNEPYRRLKAGMRHWLEKRIVRVYPQVFSLEMVFAYRSKWLAASAVTNPARAATGELLGALPPNWWQEPSFWSAFGSLYPAEATQLIAAAESVLSCRITLFQWKELDLPKTIPWSATLEPGRPHAQWPNAYYSEIEVYHDPARPDRDVKWCWELNRFQHLLPVAAAWKLTRDPRFAAEVRDQIASWMDAVQYPVGVQWSSNLEVGLRCLAWMRLHILCLDSEAWDEEFTARFLTCLYLHADHLGKELTEHHTEGNHLLGEASALACIASAYPVFQRSAVWRKRSLKILNRLVPRLFHDDGVYAEQTTGYLRFVMEFLLPLMHLIGADDTSLNSEVRRGVGKGLSFVARLEPDCRDVPMIGDADSGLAIGWRLSDFWDFSPLPAAGSVLLGQPDLAKGLTEFPAESFLMLGSSGREAFGQNESRASMLASKTSQMISFPAGGYQISRDDTFSILFDTGPLGIAPGFGHGHADGLSFILHFKGKPLLIDPGTGMYNGPPQWRSYFRSAAAHNTVRIDGEEPIRPLDTFRWECSLRIRPDSPRSGNGWRLLSGALRMGSVTHRRLAIHLHETAIIMVDRVDGSGEHDIEWRLHLDPRWSVTPLESRVVTMRHETAAVDILLPGGDTCDVSVLEGSTDPWGGWYSRYYGSIVPTTTILSRKRTGFPTVSAMALKPAGSAPVALPTDLASILPSEIFDVIMSHEMAAFLETQTY